MPCGFLNQEVEQAAAGQLLFLRTWYGANGWLCFYRDAAEHLAVEGML